MKALGGNHVVLDLGDGQYAFYFHMHRGSVRVKAAIMSGVDKSSARSVLRGDAREPYVHFEVTDSKQPLAGEGLPYLIDAYRVQSNPDGQTAPRERQLPLEGMLIDVGK